MSDPRFMLEFVHTIKTANLETYKKELKKLHDSLKTDAVHAPLIALFEVFLVKEHDKTEIRILQRWECTLTVFQKLPTKVNSSFFDAVKPIVLTRHTSIATGLLNELSIINKDVYPKA